jgi:hypothetical protein
VAADPELMQRTLDAALAGDFSALPGLIQSQQDAEQSFGVIEGRLDDLARQCGAPT